MVARERGRDRGTVPALSGGFTSANTFPGRQLTSSDAETRVEVVDDGKDGGIEVQRHPVGGDEANDGDNDDEKGVEPVDVLVPVAPGHGGIGNVHLFVPGASTAERLIVGGAIGKGLSLRLLGHGGRRRGGSRIRRHGEGGR